MKNRIEPWRNGWIRSVDWHNFDQSKIEPQVQIHLEEKVADFFLKHSKEELYEGAIKRNISLAPVSTPEDIANNPQLKDREFWVNVQHPELNTEILYPGSFAKVSGVESLTIRRRAPLVGEHNLEVYGELGLSNAQINQLKSAGTI